MLNILAISIARAGGIEVPADRRIVPLPRPAADHSAVLRTALARGATALTITKGNRFYDISLRDVEINFAKLALFYEQLEADNKSKVVIVDRYASTPEKPYKPKRFQIVFISVFSGVFLGMFIAFMLNFVIEFRVQKSLD